MKDGRHISSEVSRLKLCGDRTIEIAGQTLRPDSSTAYVEFYLSHAFPVITVDSTALHPQVVANSYRSMQYKIFDLAHIIKSYDPKSNPRDRILGTVVAVEFPDTPAQGWKVQASKAQAPGIRAVACMHKQAESVGEILEKHFSGALEWTVSMEQEWRAANSGFLVAGSEAPEEFAHETPEDLRALGWTYVPMLTAPMDLIKCLDEAEGKIVRKWHGNEVIALFGGLDGTVHYQGVGLTPLGKEKEAEVSRMLASTKLIEVNGQLVPDVVGLLKKTAELPRQSGF